jgi:hypothetical protein
VPCGEEGRTYPISLEGCVVDGDHGVEACMELQESVKVIKVAAGFFPLTEAAKNYIKLCWKRLLSAKICHLV